ncbi:hypothetical protein A3860_37745 [Niastella vici]|uniref:IPT/TIG domain-containing protein n=1 Tax=Niastella vici TaxID=1703345 RepID=A0A1V9FM33_9BACT|nr:IPT/TIG domain-containing protein [Niastella vici]OQP59404.1 hypothetical protein A3860_37745 [Niastella vici]
MKNDSPGSRAVRTCLYSFLKNSYLPLFVFFLFTGKLLAQPTISSFSPSSGTVGTTVTISGTNFSPVPANNIVYFGAVKAAVSSAASGSLTVTVPAGATYEPITVTVNNLTAWSNKPFMVTFTGGGNGFTAASFGGGADSLTGDAPYGMAVADLNDDGKPDIATVNYLDKTFSILKNTGTPGQVSFESKLDFASGNAPFGIAAGDVDGDGKPDIAITNYLDSSVSVYKNTSSGGVISFAPALIVSTGRTPEQVAIYDLDGDGRADLATANRLNNTVSLLRNTSTAGNISFAAKTDVMVNLAPAYLAVGDLNQDGKPDIAVACQYSNGIRVLKNESSTGSLAFSLGYTETTGTEPTGVAIGDLDGDGKPDLAVSNSLSSPTTISYTFSVLRNTSSGGAISFASHIDYSTTSGPQHLAISDLDGDGKADVAVSLFLGYYSIFKNNSSSGTISFATGVQGSKMNPFHIAGCDFDLDGKTDVVATSLTTDQAVVLRNRVNEPTITGFLPATAGPGETVTITGYNFTNATAVSFGGVAATSFTVVNANTITAVVGAGASGDILVTGIYGTGSLSGFKLAGPPVITSFTPTSGKAGTTVTITGTQLGKTTAVSFGGIPVTSFTVVNDTSITAIVGDGASGNVSVTTAYGTGALAGFTHLAPAITSFTPLAAGSGDTVTISGTNFTGATTVSFGGTPAISFAIPSSSVIKALVPGGSSGTVQVVTPNGSGTLAGFIFLSPAAPVITTFAPASGAAGTTVTITGTGFNTTPDGNVVYFGAVRATVTAAAVTSLTVTVPAGVSYAPISVLNSTTHLTGYSAKPFTVTFTGGILDEHAYSAGIALYTGAYTYPGQTEVIDIDGDGKPDIVAAKTSANVAILRNTSSPRSISFAAPYELTGYNTNSVCVGDLDGDGKPDIAGAATILRNTSTPGNLSFATITTGTGTGTVIADLDGDGKPELIAPNYGNLSVSVYRNTSVPGTISFAAKTEYATGGTAGDIAVGDLDGDGKPDLAVANGFNYSTIAILKNTCTKGAISFAPKVEYTTGQNSSNVRIADLDGDDKADVIAVYGTSIGIFKNISAAGSISLAARADYPVSGLLLHDINIGDADGDGLPDLLIGKEFVNYGSLGIFKNTSSAGAIALAAEASYSSGSAWSVSMNDFDLDGKPDVATALPNQYMVAVYRNQMSEPGITTFNPRIGAAGDTITITGYHFTGATAVNFGGVAATSFTVQSPTTITAVVANGASGTVQVTTPYGTAAMNGFEFAAPPTITAFNPTSQSEGSFVNITGTNFVGVKNVSFGGINAQWFQVNSSTSIDAIVDTGATGKVSVTTPGGTAVKDGFTFIHSAPTILSFTPYSGLPGTTVTITGYHLAGATAVTFNGVNAASYTVNSAQQITAVVGTGASGTVQVITPYGIAYGPVQFTVLYPPTITSFSPTSGVAGTTVTIKGTNLKKYTAVTIGGVPVQSVQSSTDTTIVVVVGACASGDVKVTTNGGSAALAGFTFIPAPTITSFTPGSGKQGDTIIITGTGLTGATAVTFGQVPAASFTVNSGTQITAVVAGGASGDVQVVTPGGTATLSGFVYRVVTAVIDPSSSSGGLVVYPNPAREKVIVEYPSEPKNTILKWINMVGQTVKVIKLNRNTTQATVNISDVAPGLYKIVWIKGTQQFIQTILVQ